ncbi:MAG: thioredoxin family protein [Gemmatales bacterium]|nr:thioredoxin family protein [Gemmatales bacterium]MDW8388137.1 thioredoxin family protein [Gemmatales bacterium]
MFASALRLAFVGVLMIGVSAPISAQEIRWRYEYGSARSEAQRAGLPLFLDFSTEWCTYCKKLDVTTFRDPEIVRLLNERFVPVKLDGNREKRLVEVLQLQGYPTLIVAGPDGRILKTLEGYVDAARLREQLGDALAALDNPQWMVNAQQEAVRLVQTGEYPKAVVLLKSVLEDDRQRPVQVLAKRQLQEIENHARRELAQIHSQAERVDPLQTVDRLEALMARYAGTQAALDASAWHAKLIERPEVKTARRRREAAEMLAQARRDFDAQHHLCCLDRCAVLATQYGDLPEGAEAYRLLEAIKANPQWLKAASERLADRLCETYLALAEVWIERGELSLAAETLQRAVAVQGSRHVEAARQRLDQLQGRLQAAP